MKTPWTDKMDREHPLPEYPRPQMLRPLWQSLNGPWKYVITKSDVKPTRFDGDIIVVNRTPSASNGEIVVAMVPDEASGEMSATVKRFYKEDGHIRLQPENDAFEPIIVDEAILLGKVVTLIRNYE